MTVKNNAAAHAHKHRMRINKTAWFIFAIAFLKLVVLYFRLRSLGVGRDSPLRMAGATDLAQRLYLSSFLSSLLYETITIAFSSPCSSATPI